MVPKVICGALVAFLLSVFNSQIPISDTGDVKLRIEFFSQEQVAFLFLPVIGMKAQQSNKKLRRLAKTTSSLKFSTS